MQAANCFFNSNQRSHSTTAKKAQAQSQIVVLFIERQLHYVLSSSGHWHSSLQQIFFTFGAAPLFSLY